MFYNTLDINKKSEALIKAEETFKLLIKNFSSKDLETFIKIIEEILVKDYGISILGKNILLKILLL